eukprot:TRINITY_DN14448_c0_g2_i1.p1 TRINITY_DN14448_c0_g2~~TRINITY_DN14448_c0_g2_i1.p1  ORF type:complete len:616 (+),score=88.54 TRINITY_DN14448_c0_g2_i1:166-1848(+)
MAHQATVGEGSREGETQPAAAQLDSVDVAPVGSASALPAERPGAKSKTRASFASFASSLVPRRTSAETLRTSSSAIPVSAASRMSVRSLMTHSDRVVLSQEEEDLRYKQRAMNVSSQMKLSPVPTDHSPVKSNRCLTIVKSTYFELFFASAIGLNTVFISVQIENDLSRSTSEEPASFAAINNAFSILFTVELLSRIMAYGPVIFFTKRLSGWNVLDVIVVFTSWLEFALELGNGRDSGVSTAGVNVSSMRMMRVLRIARVVRVVRIGRFFRFVRSLRTLVSSMMHTLKTVFWAMLLLVIIMYLFGITICQAISDYVRNSKDVDLDLMLYWGSIPRALFTLFKSISGGISWHECVTPLGKVPIPEISAVCVFSFIVYISLTTLAVLNVITGVFCESAIESCQGDRDLAIHKQIGQKHEYIRRVKELFQHMDNDESNSITLEEFEEHYKDEETAAFFASINIEAAMAWEVFKLLDADELGCIDIEDFVTGCLRLRGGATAFSIAQLRSMSERTDRMLTVVLSTMKYMIGEDNFAEAASRDFHPSIGALFESNRSEEDTQVV